MSNREKIIVILALVAVLYGAYEYLFSAKPQTQISKTERPEEVSVHISRINQELIKSSLTSLENYAIEKTQKKWVNVFAAGISQKTGEREEKEVPKVKLPVYTGYLRMEDRMIAIIDGMEYMEGDILPGSGYELLRISAGEILVRDPQKKLHPILIAADKVANPYENAQKN